MLKGFIWIGLSHNTAMVAKSMASGGFVDIVSDIHHVHIDMSGVFLTITWCKFVRIVQIIWIIKISD